MVNNHREDCTFKECLRSPRTKKGSSIADYLILIPGLPSPGRQASALSQIQAHLWGAVCPKDVNFVHMSLHSTWRDPCPCFAARLQASKGRSSFRWTSQSYQFVVCSIDQAHHRSQRPPSPPGVIFNLGRLVRQ